VEDEKNPSITDIIPWKAKTNIKGISTEKAYIAKNNTMAPLAKSMFTIIFFRFILSPITPANGVTAINGNNSKKVKIPVKDPDPVLSKIKRGIAINCICVPNNDTNIPIK
jgi:hypothetical protein